MKLKDILKEALSEFSIDTYKLADSFTPQELKKLKDEGKISDQVLNGALELQRGWKQRHPSMTIGGGNYRQDMIKALKEAKFYDTPDPKAYNLFSKWAIKNKNYIKKELRKYTDTKLFSALRNIYVAWASKESPQYSATHATPIAKNNFGRALAIMMKKDGIVFKKEGNKITDMT